MARNGSVFWNEKSKLIKGFSGKGTSGGSPSGDPEVSGVSESDVVGLGQTHGLYVISVHEGSVQLNDVSISVVISWCASWCGGTGLRYFDEGDVVMGKTWVVLGVEMDGLDGDHLLCVFVATMYICDWRCFVKGVLNRHTTHTS